MPFLDLNETNSVSEVKEPLIRSSNLVALTESNLIAFAASSVDIIYRVEWGAGSPDFSASNEGLYDPETNIDGYAFYSTLLPDQTLPEILNRITIHHAGNRIGKSAFPTVNEIQKEQIDSGEYADIAYHYAIDVEGKVYEGRPINVRGRHAGGDNTGNVGILFLRDYEPGPFFDNDPTDDNPPPQVQVDAASALIGQLEVLYGIDKVQGHNDINDTDCPGSLLEPYIPIFNSIVT